MSDNKYTRAIKEIRDGIKNINSDLDASDKKLLSLAQNASKIGSALNARTPNGLSEVLKKQNDLLQQMNDLLVKQTENTEKYNTKKKRLAELSAQEVVNQRKLAKNADEQARATSKLVGAYDNLVAKYKLAKQRLNDLNASQSKNTKEVKLAEKELLKYQSRLNKVNQATSNFSNNSLGKMVKGFRQLLGAFGIVAGVQLFVDFGKSIFRLSKTLQSLDFALRTVTVSTGEFLKVQRFVDELTIKYGVSLIETTERFTKFLAAAQQSNLSFKETSGIFETVTKASSVLGLKTDELRGVYLALEQMMSKGKVTTEELRRQLGERLPGAFGIMADALDVTIPKLDEMLKKGEILSNEALPKFAKALEEAYGIENVERVDTLVASQNRLESSYQRLVRTLTQGSGGEGGGVVYIFNAISSQIDRINQGIEFLKVGFDRLINAATGLYNAFKPLLNSLGLTEERLKSLIQFVGELITIFTTPGITFFALAINEISLAIAGISEATKVFVERLQNLSVIDFSNPITFFETLKSLFKDLDKEYDKGVSKFLEEEKIRKAAAAEKERQAILKQTAKLLVTVSKLQGNPLSFEQAFEKLKDLPIEELNAYKEQLLETLRGMQTFNTESGKNTIEALKGSIAFMDMFIKKLEEKRSKLARTSDEYKIFTRQIESAKLELEKLTDEFDRAGRTVSRVEMTVSPNYELADPSKFVNERQKELADELAKYEDEKNKERAASYQRYMDSMRLITETAFETFAELYDLDLENFEFLYDKKKNNIYDWANLAQDVIGSVLDASLNRYDIELQEAQRARDLIVNNELATEKEKRLAREKFEEEERRIKTKRAKQERINTLIKIAVDTAAGIAAAFAPPPIGVGPLAAPGYIPIIAGIGAAQAALVASQPLPKFAHGTDSPLAKDTLAWTGDGGKKEAITQNGKLVGVTPDKPTLTFLPKGSEVHSDAEEYLRNAIYNMNMANEGRILNEYDIDRSLLSELSMMRKENKKLANDIKQLAKRPNIFKPNIKLEVPQDYRI